MITGGSGSITIGTPQNIHSAATPTFASLFLEATSNQITLGAVRTVTINAPTPATLSRTYTIPDPGANASFVMTELAQTINAVKTFGSAPIITPLTATRLMATDASSALQSVTITNANGSDTTFSGATLACTLAQDIQTTASPTFVAATLTSLTAPIVLNTGATTLTVKAAAPAADNIVTIPDPITATGLAEFVLTRGVLQTIVGPKSFSTTTYFTQTINQLVIGTGTTITINAPTPAASRTYTMPDVLASASFIMSEGAQTINGDKTFGSGILLPTTGGTATALAHYEEYVHNTNLTGIWAAAKASVWDVTRVGRIVNCTLRADVLAVANTATTFIMSTALPARFRSPSTFRHYYLASDNAVAVQSRMDVQSNGLLKFWSGNGVNFAGAGSSGLYTMTFTWSV